MDDTSHWTAYPHNCGFGAHANHTSALILPRGGGYRLSVAGWDSERAEFGKPLSSSTYSFLEAAMDAGESWLRVRGE